MNLLQSGISVDVTNMPFGHLIAVLSFLLVMMVMVFINGITIKIGTKEINIGGIRKLLAKKDEDMRLKETLKRFSDEIDHDIEADLYDLIEDMEFRIERVLLREHCYFTLDSFVSIVKKELYKRVRRNNLKDKLAEDSKEKYVAKMVHEVEKRYELFQAKVSGVTCGDRYTEFAVIKDAIRNELCLWAKDACTVLVLGMKKKIEKYEASKDEFKTAGARKFCCDHCIEKNQAYIEHLQRTTEESVL
jgi:hypothetical protein